MQSFSGDPAPYHEKTENIFERPERKTIKEKLEKLTEALNNHHENSSFFDAFLSKINVSFYPKKFKDDSDENVITNQRIKRKYEVTRVTAFIDAPIELHIVSVLWILEYGVYMDARLGDCCFGNRLLLTPSKDAIVRGSSLFKPYHRQYQKWRDESVLTSQQILDKHKNALVINLDIRDYFHSVRIPKSAIIKSPRPKGSALMYDFNLCTIFYEIHAVYTKKVCVEYQVPYNYKGKLNEGNEVILPIGLLSSYILANDFLKSFDQEIEQHIKPAYYGRYVDDIL